MAKFGVIYDACVLYPAPLRDLLIELAAANLFRAKWTERIHEEWIGSLRRDRPDIDPAKPRRTRALMDAAVMDCLVRGYEHLIEAVVLPDPNDRHVVAAAIHAKLDAVVTYNLEDFPAEALKAYNLEAIHPDDFITYQMDLSMAAVLICAQRVRKRLTRPPIEAVRYLAILEGQKLPKSVGRLKEFVGVL